MDFRNDKAIYLQVVDWICEQILSEKYKTEVRVPSVRELGMTLEINPNTVMRAYDILQNQFILANKRGIGYFVTTEAKERVLSYKKELFLNEELPILFKNMQMLQIDFDELKKMYNQYFKENSHEEGN